jgi:hypothetical protein
MSTDIDMKSFAGASTEQAAAVPINDTNSYQTETQEGEPVDQEILKASRAAVESEVVKPVAPEPAPVVEQAPSPQELNFKALREEVDRMKADREKERQEYQQQVDMYRANVAHKAQEPVEEKRMFEGLKQDDIPSVGDIEKAFKQREETYQARIEELQVAQQHPDYAEVIEKYTLPLIRQKPHLAEGIQGARNKALQAYELGIMAKQAQQIAPVVTQEAPVAQQSSIAQKIVENAKKPGTLSSAGGQSVLSKADYYATMSDQEFAKLAMRNLEGI